MVLVDNLSTGTKANLPGHKGNWAFIKADVNSFEDMAAFMTTQGFDYVFHYASVVGFQRTQENSVAVLSDLEGIRVVLDLAKNTGVKRVFFLSSSEVYGEGDDVTIYGDGSQTRTFCHVDDNVAVTLKCLLDSESVNDTLNVGHDTEISILELARLVISKTRSKSKVVHLRPLKAGGMTRRQPNNAKMIELLGRPLIDLETGLERLLEDDASCKRLE